jgi:hypothetical protein
LLCTGVIDTASARGSGRSHGAPSVKVPLQFQDNFPVVMAKINGHKLLLRIDLGQTTPIILLQSAVDAVKPTATDTKYNFSDAKGNAVEVAMFKVQRVEIGGVTFSDVEGHVDAHETSAPATTTTAQGAVGFTLLRSFKVVLDYKHKMMTLIENNGAFADVDECRGTNVPFLPEWHGAPVAKAHTELADMVLIWDTGASSSVIRKKTAEDDNAPISDQIVSVRHLSLGDRDFGPVDFRIFDYQGSAGTDGFIGNDFFANHTVCIDFPGKRVLVRR